MIFIVLFHAYCLSFYGNELGMRMKSAGNFKIVSFFHHAPIKRVLGLPKRFLYKEPNRFIYVREIKKSLTLSSLVSMHDVLKSSLLAALLMKVWPVCHF